jgi:RNA polymerase sigma-70 factor (ECF subfamily)
LATTPAFSLKRSGSSWSYVTGTGNVRVLHLRARRAMESYDRQRCVPSPELIARHRDSLERLLGCLLSQDTRGLESLLVEAVQTVTDANGEYTALATPLVGRPRVSRFYLQASASRLAGNPRVDIRTVNGLPAALITLTRPVRRQAPRSLILLDLGDDGRIRTIHTVLAAQKLLKVSV